MAGLLLGVLALGVAFAPGRAQAAPIYVTFVWHMHQPIYWPGEDILETASAGHYSFDVLQTHTDRSGPYTGWPRDAVGAARAAGLGRCGAQVSLTGSLMENLDRLESAGTAFGGWKGPWQEAAAWRTQGGNPTLDLVGFGYFHPLMALSDPADVATQIRIHRVALQRRFPGLAPSHGLFPPETAFSERMIPALVAAGVDWVVVDNVHFDRTLAEYPYTSSSNLIPPNAADQRTEASPSWVTLNNIWAPGQLSAPFGYQPHYARYVDPASGQASDLIVVPGARYEGNEDARGGFGALDYDAVLSQLEAYNTDADHPMLVVLHHDGDNYGGGSDSYYHSNFAGFVSWLQANPARFQCTTIEDYLALYPPDPSDVIHVEDGSWSGADNGDPEFKKWNGDPAVDGYSPDRHSWAVITAARNRVATATAAGAMPSDEDVLDGVGDLGRAWRYLLMAQASDYWYWDGTEAWDSQVARASNLALEAADPLIATLGAEAVPPTIHLPQREPYNPGALEWGPELEDEAITLWTFAYDVSGLARVELRYRIDEDGVLGSENLRYDGGTPCVEDMTPSAVESRTNPLPTAIATRYQVTVPGLAGTLVDYWVEAEDTWGNLAQSPIGHVFVGGTGSGTGPTQCRVVGPDPDGGVVPGSDSGVDPGLDGDPDPADDGPPGCGCQGAGGDADGGGGYTAGMIFILGLLTILGLGRSRSPRDGRTCLRTCSRARPRARERLGSALVIALFVGAACGPSGEDERDASAHDASFPPDSANPTGDASLLDAGPDPDASTECTQDATGRTGTTIYLYDGLGHETGDPITVGTVVTVTVEIEINAAPQGNIGFLRLDTKNLTVDRMSFTLGGAPLAVSDPFDGLIPLTLTVGSHQVSFEAAVESNVATLEVDAALGYGAGGHCPFARSHSLAVLQVLGGVEKAVDCYDLDQARSVQVSPFVPLESTSQYQSENGLRTDVLIDNLVVGGPQCPGPGVLVHQISKCFLRQAGSTVTLSGAAYGGDPWFVDDLLLVEILDAGEDVVAALTTYQIGTQTLGCCQTPPCTSALSYETGGPLVVIQNAVQGGGNNGDIAAGAFDLTPHLPSGPGPFFLRFTALDQGVEGALDRVFLNVAFP